MQTILALINGKNINDYEKIILAIEYGAAHTDGIYYYNRNNFVSGDLNPVNQANGSLTDVTDKGVFSLYAKNTSANITRQMWFAFQEKPDLIVKNIRIIHSEDGPKMYDRFKKGYSSPFHTFPSENVTISYLPKEALVNKIIDSKGVKHYQPNLKLINQTQTPFVVEIVRNVKKLALGGKNIKNVIGSELNVSHLGLLYRRQFNTGK